MIRRIMWIGCVLCLLCIKTYGQDSTTVVLELADKARSYYKKDSILYERYFLQSIKSAQKNRLFSLEGKLAMEFGKYLFENKSYHRAFGNFNRARNIYEDLGDSIQLAESSIQVAIVQYHRGNYRISIRSFLEAISLADKYNLPHVSSSANEYLGILYNAFQNYAGSVDNFKKSLELKQKLNDHKGFVRTALKLSEIYNDNAKFDTAYYYAELAYVFVKKYNFEIDINNVLISKALSEINNRKLKQAHETIEKLDQIVAAVPKDEGLNFKYYVVKGNYYLMKGDKDNTRRWHTLAINKAEKLGYPELISFVYRNISIVYALLGDFSSAYTYEKKSHIALSQALTGDQIKNIGNLELVYGKSKSDEEVKLLNAENKLKELQLLSQLQKNHSLFRENELMDSLLNYEKNLSEILSQSNVYKSAQLAKEKDFQVKQNNLLQKQKKLTNFLWITLAALSIVSGLFFRNYRKVDFKNKIIKKQSEDLQSLMKEIHHRVKNNLQVVSSLLNLQSKYIKDAEALDAVKDSRNRVFSMALVHQQLYQDNDLRHVDVGQYIDSLCSNLMSSLNVDTEKITVEKNVEKMMLNDEILMPIGLILNELITNAIKYAFPNGAKGIIKLDMYMKAEKLHLDFKDNGIGIAQEDEKENSFGFKMIKSFLQKLKGSMQINNNNGTEINIIISKTK